LWESSIYRILWILVLITQPQSRADQRCRDGTRYSFFQVAVRPLLAFSDGLHFLVTWIDSIRTSESPRMVFRRHRNAIALTSMCLLGRLALPISWRLVGVRKAWHFRPQLPPRLHSCRIARVISSHCVGLFSPKRLWSNNCRPKHYQLGRSHVHTTSSGLRGTRLELSTNKSKVRIATHHLKLVVSCLGRTLSS
jgi:hypothetical protein